MIPIIIFLLSIGLQLTAAVSALLLIRTTGRKLAWIFIALAMVLMAGRRMVSFVSLAAAGKEVTFEIPELIALIISCLMLIGVLRIREYFNCIYSSEKPLEESEKKFRSLTEKSLVGVYLIQDGIFRYVNPRLAEIFGYMVDELIEKKGPKDLVMSEDWPIVEENIRKRIAGEVESFHYDFRGITKKKEIIHIEVYGSRIMYQGHPAVIGTLLDITERKKAEERLNILLHEVTKAKLEWEMTFDTAAEFIILVDKGLNILRCNRSFSDYIGVEIKDLIGGKFDEYLPFDPEQLQYLKNKLREEEPTEWLEVKTTTGQWFYLTHLLQLQPY